MGKWSSEEQKSCSHHLNRRAPEQNYCTITYRTYSSDRDMHHFCQVPIVTPGIRLIALGYYCSSSLNGVSSELDLDSSSIFDKRSGPGEAVEISCLDQR